MQTNAAISPQCDLWAPTVVMYSRSASFSSAKMLVGWDRRSDADSRPALAFYLFKMALEGARRAVDPPDSVTDEQVRTALAHAEERLKSKFPPDGVYGTLFRVGRQDAAHTWPVSGGSVSDAGMATPRAISFRKVGKEMVGKGGQTSTQIVILTKPPQSYMVIPLGESDHADSPHFDDQAEKLFSKSRAKPTYFLNRKELEKHVTAREELEFGGK